MKNIILFICICIIYTSSDQNFHLIGSNDNMPVIVQREPEMERMEQQENDDQSPKFFRPWEDKPLTMESNTIYIKGYSINSVENNFKIDTQTKELKGNVSVESQKELWTDEALFKLYPFLEISDNIKGIKCRFYQKFIKENKTSFQEQIIEYIPFYSSLRDKEKEIDYMHEFLSFVKNTIYENSDTLDPSGSLKALLDILFKNIKGYISCYYLDITKTVSRSKKLIKLKISLHLYCYILLNFKKEFNLIFKSLDLYVNGKGMRVNGRNKKIPK